MLRNLLSAGAGLLMLASVAAGAANPVQGPVATSMSGPPEVGDRAPEQPVFMVPIGGCRADVDCGPGHGSVFCIGQSGKLCQVFPAPNYFVACGGVRTYCPNSPLNPIQAP